jgi:toxin ParE1/3/4
MSAHRRRLTIKPDAQVDIDDILLYTREHWGVDQRHRYGSQLRKAMRSLVNHPGLGRARDEVNPGCRSLLIERHVVYYRIAEDEIVVGRILHSSQDPTGKVRP